jgi:bile acid:Na+ symporter, BASS family
MDKIYKFLLGSSAILGLLAIGIAIFGNGLSSTGLFVIGALICLAIGGLGNPKIKQMAFTMQMGKIATVGLASAISVPWMTISGSLLANWWRNQSLKEKK